MIASVRIESNIPMNYENSRKKSVQNTGQNQRFIRLNYEPKLEKTKN